MYHATLALLAEGRGLEQLLDEGIYIFLTEAQD
jgi:hypothetical protein